MNKKLKLEHIVILALWLFATAFNLNKAYHIDDTAYLEMAQNILLDPLHPMRGKVNWGQNAEPIFLINQPHLYTYLLAAWGGVFGFGEVVTHIFQSFFTLACIGLTYLIAKQIIPTQALFVTALITLSPAFVVGQNLMVDVPLLAFWLAFYYLLLKPNVKSETMRLLWAGFWAGCACLIKYSSLPLILVMFSYIIAKKQWRLLWTMSVPFGMLGLWSAFNYMDYGAIHILDRPSPSLSLDRIKDMAGSWLIALGAILPYTPYIFGNLEFTKKKWKPWFQMTLALILFISFLVFWGIYQGSLDSISFRYLFALFIGNGISICLLLLHNFQKNFREIFDYKDTSILILYLWLISGAAFIIFFSPFMATRHVLLVLVPISLLATRYLNKNPVFAWQATALFLTVSLTLGLGISDFIWANYYREQAAYIKNELPSQAQVYFTGHWGWQWYAKEQAMIQLEALNPQIQAGDYLVYPNGIHQQTLKHLHPELRLVAIKEYTKPARRLTFFKTDHARFYSSSMVKLPWIINRYPFDSIIVYQAQPQETGNP